MNWYNIKNIDTIDSPALLLYKERVQQNINRAVEMIKDVNLLRPHVKTNKTAEVCAMMMTAGITKFKCATIAEAEMLAMLKAKDVLLAYQPVGPKAKRLLALVQQYPQTTFGCVTDNIETARALADLFSAANKLINVYIDLNTGMNRSGIKPADAFVLAEQLISLPGIQFKGLHAYDGHLRDTDLQQRQQKSNAAFDEVLTLATQIEKLTNKPITIVAGGSPSFPTHLRRNVECSPGTFVYWDWGYKHQVPDEPFDYAALVLTRVISIVDGQTITTDLGHKSVAAENPFPRVHFLNASDATPFSQSEEHLVLKVADSKSFKVGDVLYGVPVHICPTVALYDKAVVIENNEAVTTWKVIARDRAINV
ncbi:D-TA family PLP-dependent enzyme [Lacibacter sediminis]|uniref:D-TA family PLP-dependent enzyme n=1 Tax=Lacibacter sediminis TaxID=2760713 RepID=A0A7G5XC54_9BACT|nr:D-TA family PLP-dependent enzyme [Lacibacter sediminis]QNA43057.1 D-TA family PLP-dependent enzyme [Lacibacter sediminis]